jgi:hypothetical protein
VLAPGLTYISLVARALVCDYRFALAANLGMVIRGNLPNVSIQALYPLLLVRHRMHSLTRCCLAQPGRAYAAIKRITTR